MALYNDSSNDEYKISIGYDIFRKAKKAEALGQTCSTNYEEIDGLFDAYQQSQDINKLDAFVHKFQTK